MTNILETVNQRTQLVGENRLELLLFRLNTSQLFAINVFKVKEVVKLPRLSLIPGAHPHIVGVAKIRDSSIPVINLRQAIGFSPMSVNEEANLIITEYNRSVQGFLVGRVEHIVNMTWQEVVPPPLATGKNNYLTAITRVATGDTNHMVSIIDVEKVLAEITHYDVRLSDGVLDRGLLEAMAGRRILLVDDSATARRQVRDTLEPLGIEIIQTRDGCEALALLKSWVHEGRDVPTELLMMITDAEMPEMDGYKLTHEVRSDGRLKQLYVILNTSLSGSFNQAMADKVGCDRLISKFQPDRLVEEVQQRVRAILNS